ncbi:MAG: hypothetical protein IIA40_13225 [SAR324 cluster bacterium]|nr:hypothetical protein [SAR324 cluster bacterium]
MIAQLLAIVGVSLARRTAEHRSPEQGGQGVSGILVDPRVHQNFGNWEMSNYLAFSRK